MELTELAQNYFGNTRSGSLAGPIGAFLIASLAVVTVLLIRNMNARLRRLPERFPGQPGPETGRDRGPETGRDPGPETGSDPAAREAADPQRGRGPDRPPAPRAPEPGQ